MYLIRYLLIGIILITNFIHLVSSLNYTGESFVESSSCQPFQSIFCDIDNFRTVDPFRNSLGHTSLNEARAELHKYGYLINNEPCRSKIQLFLCSLYAPVCAGNNPMVDKLLLPCRDDCEEAREVCRPQLKQANDTWLEEWDCSKFNYRAQDLLCVINTHKNQSSHNLLPPTRISPVASTTPEDICEDGLFDCKLSNADTKMGMFCIDRSLVCDGKKDCVNNSTADGLDEANCCSDHDQFFCDGKCISVKTEFCDGKVDCSSGYDESDCYDYTIGLGQSIVCVSSLLLALYFLVRFFHDDRKSEPAIDAQCYPSFVHANQDHQYDRPSNIVIPHLLVNPGNIVDPTIIGNPGNIISPNLIASPNNIVDPTIIGNSGNIISPNLIKNQSNILDPNIIGNPDIVVPNNNPDVYQEGSFRSMYEVLNPGHYSGTSSIYSSDMMNSMSDGVPPAPPPTPTQ